MSGRSIALMLFLPLAMIAAVGLVLTEEVLQSKEATKAQADTRKDPLIGMRFNSASRSSMICTANSSSPRLKRLSRAAPERQRGERYWLSGQGRCA